MYTCPSYSYGTIFWPFFLAGFIVAAHGQAFNGTLTLPNSIGLVPTGIGYSQQLGQFLISSLNTGQIYLVNSNTGLLSPFIQTKELIATTGIEVNDNIGFVAIANNVRFFETISLIY